MILFSAPRTRPGLRARLQHPCDFDQIQGVLRDVVGLELSRKETSVTYLKVATTVVESNQPDRILMSAPGDGQACGRIKKLFKDRQLVSQSARAATSKIFIQEN